MRPRIRSFAFASLVLLCGLAAPALAGVRADFDHDGVLDTATIVGGARPHIRVTLSGTDGLVLLPLREHLLSLVAADLDHDGLTDLAGLGRKPGVLVWRNRGGLFFSSRRHAFGARRRGTLGLVSAARGLSSDPFSPDSLDPAATTGDDHQRLAPPIAARAIGPVAATSALVRFAPPPRPATIFSRSAASRAPPQHVR